MSMQPTESAKTIHCVWCVITKYVFFKNRDQPLPLPNVRRNFSVWCSRYGVMIVKSSKMYISSMYVMLLGIE